MGRHLGGEPEPEPESLAAFAADLRQLYIRAGRPSLRRIARAAGFPERSLAAALRGGQLPPLDVTLALVESCGGDLAAWGRRWRDASEASAPGAEPLPDHDHEHAAPSRLRLRLRAVGSHAVVGDWGDGTRWIAGTLGVLVALAAIPTAILLGTAGGHSAPPSGRNAMPPPTSPVAVVQSGPGTPVTPGHASGKSPGGGPGSGPSTKGSATPSPGAGPSSSSSGAPPPSSGGPSGSPPPSSAGPPPHFSAVAGPGCSAAQTGGSGGWSTEPSGGWGSDGCDGSFYYTAVSGSNTSSTASWSWSFTTGLDNAASCQVSVFAPSTPSAWFAAPVAHYTVSTGGEFTIDQTADRGSWVAAGAFPAGGAITITLDNRGEFRETVSAAAVKVDCSG